MWVNTSVTSANDKDIHLCIDRDQNLHGIVCHCPINSYLPNPAQKLVHYWKTLIWKSRFNTYGFINSTRGSVLRLKCKRRQLASPSTAAQGFSPGHSADGSLICSRGGPLRKQPAPEEDSLCSVLFSTILLLTYYPVEELKSRLHESIQFRKMLIHFTK